MYTVSIVTSLYPIPSLPISSSILVSYSNLSPLIPANVLRYSAGIALSPVCVSCILIPHAVLNTKLVILLPNLLLNGTLSPEKSLEPSITLSLDSSMALTHFIISDA